MVEVIGFIRKRTIQPIKKDVTDKIVNIFKLEYPKIFIESKSLLFLISTKNFKLETNIINGSKLINIPGMNTIDKNSGVKKETSRFKEKHKHSKRFQRKNVDGTQRCFTKIGKEKKTQRKSTSSRIELPRLFSISRKCRYRRQQDTHKNDI